VPLLRSPAVSLPRGGKLVALIRSREPSAAPNDARKDFSSSTRKPPRYTTRSERVYSAAEHGQSTSQYQNARQELNGLHVFWDGRSVGVIPDQAVIDAYRTIIAAENERLPSGELGAARQVELSWSAATKTSANASSAIWAKYSGS
jgi:hypothetical protein